MKKSILTITLILITLMLNAQQMLNKISIANGNITNTSASRQNTNFAYTTDTEHYLYNNNSGTLSLHGTNQNGYNDLNVMQTVSGDSLTIVNGYVGHTDGKIYNGNNVITSLNPNLTFPVRALASDKASSDIYAIMPMSIATVNSNTYHTDFHIHRINNGSTVEVYSLNISDAYTQNVFSTFDNITYIENSTGKYLFVTGVFNDPNTGVIHRYVMYDISNINDYDNINGYISYTTPIDKIVSVTNDRILLTLDNDNTIYELPNNVDLNNIHNALLSNLTPVFEAPQGLTINDISVNELSGNDFRIYVATDNGLYTNESLTSVEEETNIFEDVTLYPNPNNGTFTINNIETDTRIDIINTSGQIIRTELVEFQSNIKLNMNLPRGIYFAKLSNENSSKTIKFIKS